jgi:hypothetical protein
MTEIRKKGKSAQESFTERDSLHQTPSLIDYHNLNYAINLKNKGPNSIRAGNIGTTFLVAPICYSTN